MTKDQIQEIVNHVIFRDWTFFVGYLGDSEEVYIQVQWIGKDSDDPDGKDVKIQGRKFHVSRHAIEDEIFKTCWVAVEMALKHEAMEEFLVYGRAPFHPHNSVISLLDRPKVNRVDIVPSKI